MPWVPTAEGEVPTLGWYVIDWMTEFLAQPAREEYEPFRPTLEQEDFLLRWYELDPETGRFVYDRGLLGRPRGWGKSPILGGVAICEALADVLFDGWDAQGQPVGRPWRTVRTPLVHIAAVSEEQTANTWQPLVEMLEGPVVDEYRGIEAFDSRVILPRGSIERVTAAARTVKGAPSVFGVLDQTEEWVPSNGGPKLAQNIRTNCGKNGGRTLESPNAYVPGEQSVAESSAVFAKAIREGRSRAVQGGRSGVLLWDHREAPAATDLTDRESLVAGLRYAYGDASDHPDGCVLHDPPCPPGWAPVEDHAGKFWDPANDVQLLRADYLNQITHASDSWVSEPEWKSCEAPEKTVSAADPVVLGFDGSRGRVKGKADATALVGCRVSDGHLFTLRVWEQPDGPPGKDWVAPVAEVDREVRQAFKDYTVVGFYADPSGWAPQVAAWEAAFHAKLKVKASAGAPITVWPRGKGAQVVEHVERLRQAISNREITHDGSAALSRHVLNARRRRTRTGYLLYKAFPDSPDKIDAAYAAVMAWKARVDAIAQGVGKPRVKSRPRRIR